MRGNTKIGDVFVVNLENGNKKYFQYIISDATQLNSDVIRVFKREYLISSELDLSEIINDDIEFYAHCITKLGIQLGYWEKVGNINAVGDIDHILFRSSTDSGNPQIKVSNNWWIWYINGEQKYVGKLEGKNRDSEIGAVMPPPSIVHRMKTGVYNGIYPEYE